MRREAFANRSAQEVNQVGINEYRGGAGIGWHRDKPEFCDVMGVQRSASRGIALFDHVSDVGRGLKRWRSEAAADKA